MVKATCSVDGCERPRKARGWCRAHWGRWQRLGDVQAERTLRPRVTNGASGTTCSVPGCSSAFFALRCCRTHHSYLQRGKSFDELRPVQQRQRRGEPCPIEACRRPTTSGGLCSTHYSRRWRTGTTAAPTPRSADEIEASRQRRQEYIRRWKADEYWRDRERVLARRRVWLANNTERMKLHDARKRKRRHSRMVSSLPFTVDQLAQKVAYWGHRCWICQAPYEAIDHVKPIARGGIHALANLRPICKSCNSSKGARWPVTTTRGDGMPLIRYTYGPDIAKHGDQPILVEDVELRALVEMRRAVPVAAEELAELPKAALVEIAEEAGVEVPKRGAKGQFVKAIAEAQDPEKS